MALYWRLTGRGLFQGVDELPGAGFRHGNFDLLQIHFLHRDADIIGGVNADTSLSHKSEQVFRILIFFIIFPTKKAGTIVPAV